MSVLAKKLLVKPGQRWLLYNAPETYLSVLEPLPDGVVLTFVPESEVNGIQLFAKNSAELGISLQALQPVLKPDTILWIMYPKKTSGIATDLVMTRNWKETDIYALRPVASAAIDATWTALRFRPEEQTKTSVTSNSEIGTTTYAEYIDVVNKTITLPASIHEVLQQHAPALSIFEKLSYTNRKEYLLWVLTAKQEKTRTDRMQKIADKLLSGKKNPSDK
ncbi:YdeI/OmpD-associated family protein [Mucilaginibacter sp. Bleaf8]|uniref:YdeI/OmpD-associated family protein n=1 Tax=Mucilaginibacter sp. Bleaf8 TaxID=2834430 RepID=UPI001BCF0EB7|nr:YdeI/OmpD-associated family protein [Mucilaginibacter sp. Bleaf8]MBS7563530.1 YdeI/OmpD-associated family protein [Mucilaginibacter sp. Bleaf8]